MNQVSITTNYFVKVQISIDIPKTIVELKFKFLITQKF